MGLFKKMFSVLNSSYHTETETLIGQAGVLVGSRHHGSIPQTPTANAEDILVSFLNSGRKWRRVFCIQSMMLPHL